MPTTWSDSLIWEDLAGEAERLADWFAETDQIAALRPLVDDLAEVVADYGARARDDFYVDLARDAKPGSLLLGRRRLLEYLAIQILEPDGMGSVLADSCGPLRPSIREKLSLTRALCKLIASLGRRMWAAEPSSVEVDAEAVIQLLADLARRKFKLEGEIDIEGALRAFARVEPALYLWREAYRDHLLHAADVCLLGWLLLDALLPGTDEKFASYVAAMLGTTEDLVYANWFLAALMHDVGYSVAAIGQALDQVAYLKSGFLDELRSQVKQAIGSTKALIEETLVHELLGAGSAGLDHGVIGFLNLREILDKAIRNPGRRNRLQPACQAVLKHNLNVPVSFASEPLTALLVLCDELQEWERPRVSGARLAQFTREVTSGSEPLTVPAATISESLELSGLGLQNGQFRFTDDALQCRLTYRPPELGKFLPQRVCLEKCCNLQRLDPTGLPFPLRVTLVNQYLGPSATKEYGLEALRSYALRHPDLGLVEFTQGARDGIEILRFGDHQGRIETVSFDVQRLNEFSLLPKRIDADWDDFTAWALSRQDPYSLEPPALLREDM